MLESRVEAQLRELDDALDRIQTEVGYARAMFRLLVVRLNEERMKAEEKEESHAVSTTG